MALTLPATAGSIFTRSNVAMTFYYDVSEGTSSSEACGSSADDPVPSGWATSSGINGGVPYCERNRGYSLEKIGTNNIVAFNSALVAADPAQWCGREVKIYNADGSEFTYSGGSLYIWDGCDACSSSDSGILDLSAPTFVALKGGTCAGNNPTGLTYEVLDNYIINPSVGLGAGYSEGAGSDDTKAGSTTVAASSSPVVVTSATRAVITSAQPVVVASAQQAVTFSELAATTDTAVRSLRYSFSTVAQDADLFRVPVARKAELQMQQGPPEQVPYDGEGSGRSQATLAAENNAQSVMSIPVSALTARTISKIVQQAA
ncbi:hypothetical protein D1P53_004300 [Cryptococcus gattii VGV]|nr:hypothetical protein D1P53_004300 [Cryptococcus gattii VGV]